MSVCVCAFFPTFFSSFSFLFFFKKKVTVVVTSRTCEVLFWKQYFKKKQNKSWL
jgi:hypothetical protein